MADGKSNDGKTTDLSKLYEQSFWLYTVIIALAIRQVLVGIIPRIFNHWLGTAFQLEAPGTHNEPSFYIELFHSLVFLVVITRFYLGGVKVFAKLTQDPSPPRSWLHVLSGFIHFVLFFGWAYTPFVISPWPVSLFVIVLFFVSVWVVFWYRLSAEEFRPTIKGWMWRNVRTALCIALCVGIAFAGTQLGLICVVTRAYVIAQVFALIYVLIVSIVDFMEMLTKREPPQGFFALF